MIAAGLLDKLIFVYFNYVEKNSLGEEVDNYRLRKTLKAHIKGFDSKSVVLTNDEIVSLDKLVMTVRKFEIDNPLLYYIKYNRRDYRIVGVNNEYRDQTVLVCEAINN
jgi:head-tail adaptor